VSCGRHLKKMMQDETKGNKISGRKEGSHNLVEDTLL
jgi:hypothetical protein